jgi:ABC-type dipeptide/oligopeptide/nickel transport system permease component
LGASSTIARARPIPTASSIRRARLADPTIPLVTLLWMAVGAFVCGLVAVLVFGWWTYRLRREAIADLERHRERERFSFHQNSSST